MEGNPNSRRNPPRQQSSQGEKKTCSLVAQVAEEVSVNNHLVMSLGHRGEITQRIILGWLPAEGCSSFCALPIAAAGNGAAVLVRTMRCTGALRQCPYNLVFQQNKRNKCHYFVEMNS